MAMIASTLVLLAQSPSEATPERVGDEIALRNAWASPDTTSIVLEADIALESCEPLVRNLQWDIELDGRGHTIDQACAPQVLASKGSGNVLLRDLRVLGRPHEAEEAAVEAAWLNLEEVSITGAAGVGAEAMVSVVGRDVTVAGSGGNGIVAGSGDVFCTGCRIESNAGTGVRATFPHSTVRLWSSEVTDNGLDGIAAGGPPWVTSSTVARNGRYGVYGRTHGRIISSTVAHNGSSGVEVHNTPMQGSQNGKASVVLSTVVGNGASNVLASAQVDLAVSVVAGAGTQNCDAPAVGGKSSFADDTTCGLGAGSIVLPGGDPALGALSYNGGPTSTMRPLRGSPLIGAASWSDCSSALEDWEHELDQRGWPRPAVPGGRCDIGSVQLGGNVGLECPARFVDVAGSHPFCWEIDWMAGNGHSTGWPDGTYRPGLDISRQALAAFLWRLAGSPEVEVGQGFRDVGADSEFATAIAWAAREGITEGYPDGTFRPAAPITRQALAAMLWRLAGSPPPGAGAPSFHDVGADHPFGDAIGWLAEVEVTGGYGDGGFRPGARTTRQAMAAFLHRFDGVHRVARR